MAYGRGIVTGVAGVILVTALISGPLVPGVDLTREPDPIAYGQGNATISDVSLPQSAKLTRASYGAENYHLTVPPASVRFSHLEGNPTLAYRLKIPSIGYTRSTAHFLSESTDDSYELTIRTATFGVDEITEPEYAGVVSVVKRDSAGETVVAKRNLTVEVVE